jgi:diaminohydroxyphosphoribosylaminopyrimidine deaminase/5-amino-6-(5-phosphoribosylamino)uracil reductase
MQRALRLAKLGWGQVAPNPLVGAVLLRGGSIVGEGYHAAFGEPHAEIVALESCSDPRETTCVVNLEPCSHVGKTGPCVDALIAAGVSRVVFAVHDPDPEASGGGQRLRRAGIEVEIGVCRDEAVALNAPFLCSKVRPDRPFVALKIATSLDGFLTDSRKQSRWISGPEAREWVHWLRAGFDAIAVGRRTALLDDPQLTARGDIEPRVPPKRVVLGRKGPIERDLQLVRSARDIPTLLVVDPEAVTQVSRQLEGTNVTIHEAVGLEASLRLLRQQGIESVLVEGGGLLAGALLDEDLLDRVYWIQAPLWLGAGTPAFAQQKATSLSDVSRWTVVEQGSLGGDTLLVVDRRPCLLE